MPLENGGRNCKYLVACNCEGNVGSTPSYPDCLPRAPLSVWITWCHRSVTRGSLQGALTPDVRSFCPHLIRASSARPRQRRSSNRFPPPAVG